MIKKKNNENETPKKDYSEYLFVFFFVISFSAIFLFLTFSPVHTLHTGADGIWGDFSDVAVDKEWRITFSKNIDESTVEGNVYILSDGSKIPVNYRVEGKKLFVKPKKPLNYSSEYSLVLEPNVKDLKGNVVENSVTLPFKTVNKSIQKVPASQTITTLFDVLSSEYNMEWQTSSTNYKEFFLEGYSHGQKVALYDTRNNVSISGIEIGVFKINDVKKKYGEPIATIRKGNTLYKQAYKNQYGDETHGTYLINNDYVTFFYDVTENYTVRSIFLIAKSIEETKNGYYKQDNSNKYRDDLEEMTVHLINATRVEEGLKALIYTPIYNRIARLHSEDMARNNYFSHTDLSGNKALQRMRIGGLPFHYYGENLAYGQYSAIFAHESLMNSESHRANILSKSFTHIIVGVAFNSQYAPYYTINFYSQK